LLIKDSSKLEGNQAPSLACTGQERTDNWMAAISSKPFLFITLPPLKKDKGRSMPAS